MIKSFYLCFFVCSNKLNKMKGSLSVQLFDEYIEDLLEDDRYRTTEIYQRISSKWLGELRIPVSTIYSNHRVSFLTNNESFSFEI